MSGKKEIEMTWEKCKLLFFIFLTAKTTCIYAQSQVYDNFEGIKLLRYSSRTGVLDTAVKNPARSKVNNSDKCALYVRNKSQKFDNIKMSLNGKLNGVSSFATYSGIPLKIKMKVYTTGPAGMLVEILLGSKGRNNEYPAGTHSQYQAYTTRTNAWEELEFTFSQVPQGSETSESEVDQVTVLFNPNSTSSDTYYFDEITGPLMIQQNAELIVPVSNTIKKEKDE